MNIRTVNAMHPPSIAALEGRRCQQDCQTGVSECQQNNLGPSWLLFCGGSPTLILTLGGVQLPIPVLQWSQWTERA